LLGALSSFVLWVHQANPHSELFRFMSSDFGVSSASRNALLLTSGVLGGVCLLIAVMTAFGSRSHGATVLVGLALGVFALSYPFAYFASFVSQPITHSPLAK
jgi:hypothetical protein